MTAIVGKGVVKDESTVPVRIPREAMVGTGEGKAELTGEKASHREGDEGPTR